MLFLFSAGLQLFTHYASGRASVASMLLAVFLAFWSYVLGIAGLLFISVRWIRQWLRERDARAAMSGSSTVEVTRRGPAQLSDHSEMSGRSILPTREIDGDKTTSCVKVA